MPFRNRSAFAAAAAWLLVSGGAPLAPHAQAPAGARVARIAPASVAQLREWDQRVDSMMRTGGLRIRQRHEDRAIEGRSHERADQFHRGVRVVGGDIARQLQDGQVVSVFGTVYESIAIDVTPAIEESRAIAIVEARSGATPAPAERPELTILPDEVPGGAYRLAWRIRAAVKSSIRQYFVDARTGTILLEYDDVKTQAVRGEARGVLGDRKKISVTTGGGGFVAEDPLRPPTLRTYDMKGNMGRVNDFISGRVTLSPTTELAVDADNNWTDGAAVDAHVYAGLTYDFFFKRFNRRGLNNADIRIISLVHPARREDVFTDEGEDNLDFFVNAGYYGSGIMIYGVGLPPGITSGGQSVDFLSGALDIVAHELTHGITDYTSDLIYRNESGALNEAFSDIMSAAVEFTYQPPGSGSLRADYLLGEDVIKPGGFRSMADPGMFGDPDHYSRRFTGTQDNGGVHINSGIANHAFYLAIEGGTNRTSGLGVQGVGAANRQQIEGAFYRAFTELMPSNATFSTARAATIQAARDLHGVNSAAERAITQAWTAVGVE
jgi:thermolysin